MLVVYVNSGVVTKLLNDSWVADPTLCRTLGVLNENPAVASGVPVAGTNPIDPP